MSREFLMATTCHHGFTLFTKDRKIFDPPAGAMCNPVHPPIVDCCMRIPWPKTGGNNLCLGLKVGNQIMVKA